MADMPNAVCPICRGPADVDPTQELTLYCRDPKCNFMGILPEEKKE